MMLILLVPIIAIIATLTGWWMSPVMPKAAPRSPVTTVDLYRETKRRQVMRERWGCRRKNGSRRLWRPIVFGYEDFNQ